MKRQSLVQARRWLSAAHAELAGEPHPAKLNNTIGYYYSAQARRLGHKNAFRVPHQGVNWTYIEVKKNSDAFAEGLMDHGIKPGDNVLSIQPSTAELYMTHAACAKLGAVCVNVSPYTATVDAIGDAIEKYQPKVIVIREFVDIPTAKGTKRTSIHEMLYQNIPELDQVVGNLYIKAPKYPSVKLVIVADANLNLHGTTSMRDTCLWGPFNYYESRLRRIATLMSADHPSLILPSSTGNDVVYTHKNIMTAAFHTSQFLGLRNDDRVMLAPQTGHTPLFFLSHYACLASGATLSYGGEHLNASQHVGPFLETLEVEKVHGLVVAKEQLDILLPVVKGQGVGPNLKWVMVATEEKLSTQYANEVREAFKVQDVFLFDGPLEAAGCLEMSKVNAEGRTTKMMPNTELRVVGDDGGEQAKTLGRGIEGGLRAKGPSIASQYWNNAGLMEASKDVLGFWDLKKDATVSSEGEFLLKTA
eukprot:TRINITY_DN3874_c0_g2_i1.p1 TRINITY_DN3874_c0_g2~~TRINITY_DN3874_c0_g2_i1.p1  ORF type:complete len:474 (+),score=127.94 TRINITY_DN3874_c0_g2_i1:51-1472(+)